jgi:DNA-binding response OmpR family regulator
MVDREFAGNISTRKLVIETAKFNVITAYSAREAVIALKRFPGVDGIVLDAGINDIEPSEFVRTLKLLQPLIPIIVIGRLGFTPPAGADYQVDSFDPRKILLFLQSLRQMQVAEIEENDDVLTRMDHTSES